MSRKTTKDRREIDFAPGEKTYGLRIFREIHEIDGQDQVHWTYDLPDGVVVLPVTADRKIVAVKKTRPGVGEYPQIPAESMSKAEMAEYRQAMAMSDHHLAESVLKRIAARCLIEETGYLAGRITVLTTISQHTGKTPMVHAFCLAEGCSSVLVEGTGQAEEGITLLPLSDSSEIWRMLTAYIGDSPIEPHGGKNSIVALSLALHKLGALRVESIPEFRGNPIVVALRGLPLSGKTTLGKLIAAELNCHFIDVDVVRDALVGRPDRGNNPNPWLDKELSAREGEDMRLAYTAMHEGVRASIELGRSVVLCATYSKPAAQGFLRDIVAAHPGARLIGIKCSFDDTKEEIIRRLSGERGRGGCLTVEHYLRDRELYNHVALWSKMCDINTSQPLEVCLAQAMKFIQD